MLIRSESENDVKAVRSLNASVFETEAEANLVDALRKKTHPFISLVAEDNNEKVSKDAFMVIELQPSYLHGKSSIRKYHAEFKNV